jgi:hypothetical protein
MALRLALDRRRDDESVHRIPVVLWETRGAEGDRSIE